MRWFYNLRIIWKVVGGFTAIAAIAAVVGGIGYWGVRTLGQTAQELGVVRLAGVENLLTIKGDAQRIKAVQSALLDPSISDTMRATHLDSIAKIRDEYAAAWKAYEALPRSDEEEAAWKELGSAWEVWRTENDAFLRLIRELQALRLSNPYDLKTNVEATYTAQCLAEKRTSEMITTKQVYKGGDSHRECVLGKFVERYVTENPELRSAIQAMEEPHVRFHNAVVKIKELVAKDDLVAAKACYEKEFQPAAKTILAQLEVMTKVADKSLELLTRCQQQANGACLAAQTKANDLLDRLVKINASIAQESVEKCLGTERQAEIFSLVATIGGAIAALVMGVCLALHLSRPILKAVGVMKAMAEGDFTRKLELDTKDEIGQMARALNAAIEAIRTALQETRTVADSLASASQQLSAAAEEISSGAQEQASSLEETASSLEEITSTVSQNADNAQQANQLAAGTRDVAEKGGRVVGDAVRGMAEINTASKKIADIITAIDEIAFQTNLLALNAAVEAARAGEQGRGFAVVAGEVRNLAQRSAAAAKEIKGLIQDSVRKVEAGSDLVNQSGETLSEIVTSVKRVTDIVSEIAAASREQAGGIEQVNKAVSQMDKVTQSNASQTEELASTAEGLAAQAQQLQALVARFKIGETSRRRLASTNEAAAANKTAPAKSVKSVPASPSARRAPQVPRAIEDSLDELELVGAGAASNGSDGFQEF